MFSYTAGIPAGYCKNNKMIELSNQIPESCYSKNRKSQHLRFVQQYFKTFYLLGPVNTIKEIRYLRCLRHQSRESSAGLDTRIITSSGDIENHLDYVKSIILADGARLFEHEGCCFPL